MQRQRAARGVSARNAYSSETARLRCGERHVGAQAAEEALRRERWCWAHTDAKRIHAKRVPITVKVSPSSSMAAAEGAATSKSFRAILPNMAAEHVTKLRRYCAENFAASAVFVDSPGERASEALAEVVWLGRRDRPGAVARAKPYDLAR